MIEINKNEKRNSKDVKLNLYSIVYCIVFLYSIEASAY